MLHQGGDGDHVHIAAGQHAHHIAVPAVQVLEGRDGKQSRVLHHHFVLLHHVQKGVHQLAVVDGDDAVQVPLDVGEHLVAGGFHRHAVGDGGHLVQRHHPPRLQAGLHGRRPGGLHPDHLHRGVKQLGQGGHPRRQPAAPHRDQDHVHIGQVLENLIGDGALAGGHGEVVEGVDVGEPLLPAQLCRQRRRVVEGFAVEHHLGPVVLGIVHLYQGGGGGHDDGGRHPRRPGGVGHPLGVVARRGGHQPALLLLIGEGGALEVGPTDFICPGDLHVFRLDIYLVAGGSGEKGAVHQVCAVKHAVQHPAGGAEIV